MANDENDVPDLQILSKAVIQLANSIAAFRGDHALLSDPDADLTDFVAQDFQENETTSSVLATIHDESQRQEAHHQLSLIENTILKLQTGIILIDAQAALMKKQPFNDVDIQSYNGDHEAFQKLARHFAEANKNAKSGENLYLREYALIHDAARMDLYNEVLNEYSDRVHDIPSAKLDGQAAATLIGKVSQMRLEFAALATDEQRLYLEKVDRYLTQVPYIRKAYTAGLITNAAMVQSFSQEMLKASKKSFETCHKDLIKITSFLDAVSHMGDDDNPLGPFKAIKNYPASILQLV